ncbi:MAG TPA: amidohydrolase family protein [Actinomycetes bacterium]|nr:amidohydrolase family protein [Actinomycetes bacterium]
MDSVDVATMVNLDGRWGAELTENVARYDAAHPGRFLTFCHVDWGRLADRDMSGSVVSGLQTELAESAARGARGVKVWKDLGLTVRDSAGALVQPDDPRVVSVLRTAGDLGLPVLIHTADPVAFFDPLDESNERLDELSAQPEWWFGREGLPSFAELITSLDRLVGACPGTTFIGAHVGCWAENLDQVGRMLARHPNWHVDLAGRLGEIGRQPRTFRRFVERFPDRVLFGSDAFPPSEDPYRRYYRFLETDDDHFPYTDEKVPPQGRWSIYGCALAPRLLPALYAGNAKRLLGLPSAGETPR